MPQQQSTAILELIRCLRHFGGRPGMCIRPVDVQNAQSFLGGVTIAAQVLAGVPYRMEDLKAVVAARGWRLSDRPIPPPEEELPHQMRQRGMSDAQIIAELAEIEAVMLERQLAASA